MNRLKVVGLGIAGTVALAFPSVAQAATTVDVYGDSYGKEFYPFVHDGYRDNYSAGVDFSSPYSADYCDPFNWSAQVINSATGTAIRTFTGTETPDNYPTRVITWNAHKNNGTLVNAGGYFSIKVTAGGTCYDSNDDPFDVQESDVLTGVHPARGHRTLKHTIKRNGRNATSHGSTGWCLSQPDGYGWTIDCAGVGGSAWVTYKVTRPVGSTWSGWAFEDYSSGPVYHSHTDSGRTRTFKAAVPGYAWADATTPVEFDYKVKVRI